MTDDRAQQELEFEEAKQSILDRIDPIEGFLISTAVNYQEAEALDWLAFFRSLRTRVEGMSEAGLEGEKIVRLQEFGQYLCELFPPLQFQLDTFWNLLFEATTSLSRDQEGYRLREDLDDLHDRLEEADSEAASLAESLASDPTDPQGPKALLLNLVERVQSIEYPIRKTCMRLVNDFNLSPIAYSDFVIAWACSVEGPIQKGDVWRSDVRAIRDAVAHHRYTVDRSGDHWAVDFHNTEDGYDFRRRYSRAELYRVFDLFTVLYKTQLQILNTMELLVLTSTHLVDGTT